MICIRCGRPFPHPSQAAVLCGECRRRRDQDICFEGLHIGEGFIECWLADKSHGQPHFWEGTIDGNYVRIEWRKP